MPIRKAAPPAILPYAKGPDFAPHNMISWTSPPPFVISASSYYFALADWHVYDGGWGSAQYWITDGVPTGWVKIDLGAGNTKKLYSYGVRVNLVPEPNRAPKNWILQGSNNDADWTDLNTQTNQTGWGSGEVREYTLSQAMMIGAYRYFRLNISLNNGDPSYVQVAEMYLYEAV